MSKLTKDVQLADLPIEDFSKVNHLQITESNQGQRLDNFLLSKLKGLPKAHVYRLIRKGEIRVNKKRAKAELKLELEDVVRVAPVRLSVKEAPTAGQGVTSGLLSRVVYEDERLLVINKPHGLAVHGGSGLNFGVVEALRQAYPYLELVHRIDKDTSGLLMLAKKRSALREAQGWFREKQIKKTYLALLDGVLEGNSVTVNEPLERFLLASGERRVRVSAQGKPSKTVFVCQQRFESCTLVEAKPVTGRTHQIRVHAQFLGLALVGDSKYNPHAAPNQRLCLHASQLILPNGLEFSAPAPQGFMELAG